jgi:hypothetical protein
MEQNERQMIDGLFDKLRQAEQQSGPRDPGAEKQIAEALARQPAAAYYMAQVILVQEHAVQAQNQRIQELEKQLAERPAAGGGGFLSGLFGGGANQQAAAPAARTPVMAPGTAFGGQPAGQPLGRGWSNQAAPAQAGGFGGGGGFLASALTTAAGVAGGVMLANALGGMFGGEAHAAEHAAAAEPAATPDSSFAPDMSEPAPDDSFFSDGGDFQSFDDF